MGNSAGMNVGRCAAAVLIAVFASHCRADLADAEDITAFPIEGKASSFAFSGFGEVGGFGGDYELLPGFGVRLR